jgi:glycogen synthase
VRYVDEGTAPFPPPVEGHQPLGNSLPSLDKDNLAGDAAAVIRRRVFDLGFWYSVDATSYEDWLFYRRLAASGFLGHAIPERLIMYRVRGESMVRMLGHKHHDRLLGEMEAQLRAHEMEWTPSSA